jgi:hypothetical protein
LPAFLPIEVSAVPGSALASVQLAGSAVINVFNAEVFSFLSLKNIKNYRCYLPGQCFLKRIVKTIIQILFFVKGFIQM